MLAPDPLALEILLQESGISILTSHGLVPYRRAPREHAFHGHTLRGHDLMGVYLASADTQTDIDSC